MGVYLGVLRPGKVEVINKNIHMRVYLEVPWQGKVRAINGVI